MLACQAVAAVDVGGKDKWLARCVHLKSRTVEIIDECCTALTGNPLNRLLLLAGLTPDELKFRL